MLDIPGLWRIFITLIFLVILFLTARSDIRTMEIPDCLVVAAGCLGLVSIPFFEEITLAERVIGIWIVSTFLFLIVLIVPGSFGGGDIKLSAACGIFLGWRYMLLAFVLAVLTGGIYAAGLLVMKRANRKSPIAFGPFLCLGMAAAALWGEPILEWWS